MEVISAPEAMTAWSEARRKQDRRIALVPTMGYLHDGHLSLIRWAVERAEDAVVSIFVNPTQFGPHEDFGAYPRDMERDLALCRRAGTRVVFAPEVEDMYPAGFQTVVSVKEVSRPLCGATRPGHFDGVATVVTKLFTIVRPHWGVFGEKDYQQLLVIKRFTRDLNLGVEVVGRPTLREPDGLAMSSRNKYLTPEQRPSALSLSRSLALAEELVAKGEREAESILRKIRDMIEATPGTEIDYAELRDPETLVQVNRVDKPALLALAVKVGRARLIDNRIIG
ncbi:MAG: pantoate--beta-alanine ligase [Proteobacteria bacterium]|nr:pantoate--beta-alanine ligase [Pseudomonadota bacterium]